MGFFDNPIVDKNAERSDESVIKSQLLFSLKNGFNSHSVDGSKDYGVDIYSEIIDLSGATGNLFPIQIKSTRKAQFIIKDSIKYFTLTFPTSRLGYLSRHTPNYGIIVLYNESDETLYYDYLWEIYNRIRLDRKDESWKEKKTVTIHIPDKNIVERDIKKIHKTFLNRFHNTNVLIEEHGNSFNIPSFNHTTKAIISTDKAKDKEDIYEAIRFLETIGTHLFNDRKYSKIITLLEMLPKRYFSRPKISYIAALTYAEMGELLDADYFLKICYTKKSDYSDNEFIALEIQKYKVDFAYGLYDIKDLISQLKQIRERAINNDNLLNIDININMLELYQKIGGLSFDKNFLNEIDEIFKRIEKTTQNQEQKHFQRIFHSENLISAITRIYSDFINDNYLLNNITDFDAIKLRQIELNEILDSFMKVGNIISESLEYAISENNKLMKAHALHKLAVCFFSINFSLFTNNKSPEKDNILKILESSLTNSISAYNLFVEINVYQYAYYAINLAYDIYRLIEEWLEVIPINICTIEELKNKIKSFNKFEFSNQYNSVIDKIVSEPIERNENRNLNDEEYNTLAERIIKVRNLPKNRKENILEELKSIAYFVNNCTKSDLIILSNQESKGWLAYNEPSKYAIACKKTHTIYSEGFNIKEMMQNLEI